MQPKKMQEHNAYLILQLVRNRGPLSRADIARALNCSRSAVSNIISWLGSVDLIQVVGTGNPPTGKKSKLLSFNPEAHYLAAVDLKWGKRTFGLVDLAGNVRARLTVADKDTGVQQCLRSIVEKTDSLLRNSGVPRESVIGMGLTVPGIVDNERGTVIYSSSLGWNEPFPLSERLSDRIQLPAYLENDANALALGEAWTGNGSSFSDIAYVFVGRGVGGAYIHNNEILRGKDFASTEFGKIIISSAAGPVRAEEALSFSRVLTLYDENLDAASMTNDEILDVITEIVARRSERAEQIMARIVDKLGQLVATIVAILNPEAIIIKSPYLAGEEDTLERVGRKARTYLPERPERKVNIIPSGLGDNSEVIGGAAVALSHSYLKFIIKGEYSPYAADV